LLTFPEGFLWSTSTAAYQIEGGWNVDGKGLSIWDTYTRRNGKIKDGTDGDVACDSYHRYMDDIKVMKEIGVNSYRFSISWPRIMPDGTGRVNQAGLDYYRRLVDALRENDIEPLITLFHWDLPQTLQDKGGWLNRDVTDYFADYVHLTVDALKDQVTRWLTINEINIHACCGHMNGEHAPGFKDDIVGLQVFHNLLLAHGKGVIAGRSASPGGKFGYAPNLDYFYAADSSVQAQAERDFAMAKGNGWVADPVFLGKYPADVWKLYEEQGVAPRVLNGDLKIISQPIDFLGVNFYFANFLGEKPADAGKTDWHALYYPKGLTDLLVWISERYASPEMVITESGCPELVETEPLSTIHDTFRVNYLRDYIKAVHEAIQKGAKVKGYSLWSLLDNMEWQQGYTLRFGIVQVDFKTFERKLKDSARYYSKVVKANAWTE